MNSELIELEMRRNDRKGIGYIIKPLQYNMTVEYNVGIYNNILNL